MVQKALKSRVTRALFLTAAVLFLSCRHEEAFFKRLADAIVISQTDHGMRQPARTLQRYIKRMAGRSFPVITDDHACADREIILGKNAHLDSLHITVNCAGLGNDGFHLMTSGSHLVIAGSTPQGVLNGVYTLLERYFGCRRFSAREETVPRAEHLRFPQIDDRQVPVIEYREIYYKDAFDPGFRAWHKLHSHRDAWGMWVHTFDDLVPPEDYFKSHPEYFTWMNGMRVPDGQLCLAHPDVYRLVVEGLKERMAKRPEALYWSVSQNDTYNPCQCEECNALNRREGSPSGSLLWFVNRVAAEFPDKMISTLAYQYTRSAPVHLRPVENVNIVLCSIECNRSKPIAVDPSSASFVRDLRSWARIAPHMLIWDYVVQFRNLVSPFPNLRVLQPNLQFFVKNGVKAHFQQGSGTGGEFAELRTTLIAKLLWDPYVKIDSVMNDFLAGYYGPAAASIRAYIDDMHDALETSGEKLLIYGYPLPSEKGIFSAAAMDRYRVFLDSAEESVRGRPQFMKRVEKARLPWMYAMLEQAKVYGTGERGLFRMGETGTWSVRHEMDSLLQEFVRICKKSGIGRLEEYGTSPDEYKRSMKRFMKTSIRPHKAMFKPVALRTAPSPLYPAGGAAALTNGLKGPEDYHMNWLGFEGSDMEAVIDLGVPQPVHRVRTDFLQAIVSWVFLPVRVEFSLSGDGIEYSPAVVVLNRTDEKKGGIFIESFTAVFPMTNARFIRVRAENMKICPAWHKGAGGAAWIFTDEIVVE